MNMLTYILEQKLLLNFRICEAHFLFRAIELFLSRTQSSRQYE